MQTLCIQGTFKLDRLARSVPDARGIKLTLGQNIYYPTDSLGKMFFNVVDTFAEFEGDLIFLRTKEGIAIALSRLDALINIGFLPGSDQVDIIVIPVIENPIFGLMLKKKKQEET
ncbi:recombinase family protein [Xenorhabdus sp. ZM]|nr:recombinase family protein [Xenorhabdus sp. ZM]